MWIEIFFSMVVGQIVIFHMHYSISIGSMTSFMIGLYLEEFMHQIWLKYLLLIVTLAVDVL